MRARTPLARATIGLAALAAVACGGAAPDRPTYVETPPPPRAPRAPDGPVNARGDESLEAVVGAPGGTLELANGARLEIPAGALTEPLALTFGVSNTSGALRHEGTQIIGPALLAQPGAESAAGPFVLSVPFGAVPDGFTDADLALAVEEENLEQRALEIGGRQTRWQNYPVTRAGDRIACRLPALPGYRFQFVVSR